MPEIRGQGSKPCNLDCGRMQRMSVTPSDALPVRLLAWANERFPPIANAVLCAFLYGAAVIGGRAESSPGPIAFSLRDGLGFLAVYAALLMLRVYDEHKDYAIDLKNHPGRVLQRGLITLGHLKVLGGIAIAMQLGVSLFIDAGSAAMAGAVTQRWLLVFVWSALMAKEFFIGEWLTRHLLLYAISHMVVLPMAVLWVVQQGAGQAALTTNAYLLSLVALLGGFAFEIGRKTRAPADERPTVDSYTKVLGLHGAVTTLILLSVALGGVLALLLLRSATGLGLGIGLGLAGLAALLPCAPLLSFLRQPSSRGSKGIEAAIALQTLLVYGAVAATWLVQRGATWR